MDAAHAANKEDALQTNVQVRKVCVAPVLMEVISDKHRWTSSLVGLFRVVIEEFLCLGEGAKWWI